MTGYSVLDMKNEVYHGDPNLEGPSLSRGTIHCLVDQTPAHAWQNHPRLNPDWKPEEDVEKFDLGTAVHALFLQGIDYLCIVEADSWRTKEAKIKREEARVQGMIPMLPPQAEKATAMARVATASLFNSELHLDIQDMDHEVSYFWKEKNGVWCRARLDAVTKDRSIILDFKTTGIAANPDTWGQKLADEIQEAFYRRAVKMVDGKDARFIFMVQEDEPPYLCSFISLLPDFQELGHQRMMTGIRLWEQCLKYNMWPGYPQKVAYISPPAWKMTQWEMKRMEIELMNQEEI